MNEFKHCLQLIKIAQERLDPSCGGDLFASNEDVESARGEIGKTQGFIAIIERHLNQANGHKRATNIRLAGILGIACDEPMEASTDYYLDLVEHILNERKESEA